MLWGQLPTGWWLHGRPTHAAFQLDGPVLHTEKLHGGLLVAGPPALLLLVAGDHLACRVLQQALRLCSIPLGLPELLMLFLYLKSRFRQLGAGQDPQEWAGRDPSPKPQTPPLPAHSSPEEGQATCYPFAMCFPRKDRRGKGVNSGLPQPPNLTTEARPGPGSHTSHRGLVRPLCSMFTKGSHTCGVTHTVYICGVPY